MTDALVLYGVRCVRQGRLWELDPAASAGCGDAACRPRVVAGARQDASNLSTAGEGLWPAGPELPAALRPAGLQAQVRQWRAGGQFTNAVKLVLPDVSVTLPDYISVARVDPDSRGVRFGLRTAAQINSYGGGRASSYIDLLPHGLAGPAAQPAACGRCGTERARQETPRSRRSRSARRGRHRVHQSAGHGPVARNPTFMRSAVRLECRRRRRVRASGRHRHS